MTYLNPLVMFACWSTSFVFGAGHPSLTKFLTLSSSSPLIDRSPPPFRKEGPRRTRHRRRGTTRDGPYAGTNSLTSLFGHLGPPLWLWLPTHARCDKRIVHEFKQATLADLFVTQFAALQCSFTASLFECPPPSSSSPKTAENKNRVVKIGSRVASRCFGSRMDEEKEGEAGCLFIGCKTGP